MSIYDDLLDLINEASLEIGKKGKEFKSSDIKDWIAKHSAADWERYEPSFQVNFSSAVNTDEECRIERVPGKFLYRSITEELDPPEIAPASTEKQQDEEISATKIQREIKLYSTLKDWLESNGYQSEITSKTKSGGVWGNPDVTGLRLDELPIGPVGLECTTIEAKLSLDNWKQFIFETVAHKRFSHRAWFAFAVGTSSPSISQIKEAKELSEYAEKYRIGVLVVFISQTHYDQLTTGDAVSLELSPDDVSIEILWPASHEHVGTPSLNNFMKNVLDIQNNNDFGRFGR